MGVCVISPQVSVVIGSYNRLAFLKVLIKSLRQDVAGLNHEIIVVDGGSTDGSIAWLMRQKDIITIVQYNRGVWKGKTIERRSWGYFMNLGFKSAQGKYICMLSDDCLVVPGALSKGIRLFEQLLEEGKKVGAMAFYWRNWPEQKKYMVGKVFGNNLSVNHGLYLRSAFAEIGFADEEAYFFYHGDGDICLRLAEKGYQIVDSPDSYIEHYSDANPDVRSSNTTTQPADWTTYTKRWAALGDPDVDWIYKGHTDPLQTAKTYWRPLRSRQRAKQIVKKALRLTGVVRKRV